MTSFRSSQEKSARGPESGAAAGPVLRSSREQLAIHVLIAMSSHLERMAWGIIVRSQPDMQLVAQVASCDEALALLKTQRSDVTLIDEAMLAGNEYEALLEYSRQPMSSRFVVVAPHQVDYSLQQAKHSFMHAYLLKGVSAPELLGAIRTAVREAGS
jgi:DNA-binding NarL/FixJ family response regulator